MLMIIIPVCIVAIITSILMPVWSYFVKGMNPNAHLTDSLGFITVYQLQRNVSSLEKLIIIEATYDSLEYSTSEVDGFVQGEHELTHENLSRFVTPQALSICEGIEKTGAMLVIMINEEQIYITAEASLDAILQIFEKVNQNNDIYMDSMINSSHSGTVLTSVSDLVQWGKLRIVVANPTLTGVVGGTAEGVSENLINFGEKFLIAIFFITVAAVLITNGLLAIISSKAILKPLRKLREATHEIRDGNLDYEVDYVSKNELGQVCLDFDEMRQRLKTSVEAQQKYEESRVEMIACISHDLGTPLTSIKGYTSGLIDGIADTPEKRNHYLKTIYYTANAMDKLVGELSMSSKLELDKVPFYFETIEISDFFKQYEEELFTTLDRCNIKYIFKNILDKKEYISLDLTQFRRAVLNIIDNCIKYKKSDCPDSIVLIELSKMQDKLNITISDNGQGVPESEIEKIFNSFYRGDNARNCAGVGSGLGLSITSQIVKRHRGKIWAEKSAIGGLAVKILLPLQKEDTTR